MKKLWYNISLLGIMCLLIPSFSACKSAKQDQGSAESSGATTMGDSVVVEVPEGEMADSAATASMGAVAAESDSTKGTAIKHVSPEQAKIDSIKKAKTDQKRNN